MQKIYLVLIFLILFEESFSQILISPYIVYTDNINKVGNLIVQNESENNYQVSISFLFGYPVSDSAGQITMKYLNVGENSEYSIHEYIRAFPKKFILQPKQRQVVRLTIKAPDTLKSGTYWTRIVTSAVPYSEVIDTTSKGITAKIRFVLNQVTTCLYRVEPAESGITLDSVILVADSSNTKLKLKMTRIGNSPFIGDLIIKLLDENEKVIKEFTEYIPVYFDLTRQITIDSSQLEKNKPYFLTIKAVNTEKEDLPDSRLKIISEPDAKISFKIPKK